MLDRNAVLLMQEQLLTDDPDRWEDADLIEGEETPMRIFNPGTMAEPMYRILCEVVQFWLDQHSK